MRLAPEAPNEAEAPDEAGAPDEIDLTPGEAFIDGSGLDTPERLDVVLARIIDAIPSRSFAARLIENGLVTVNGKVVKASMRLEARHVARIDLSFLSAVSGVPTGERIPLAILHEDDDILIIDKPAGMVVHPGAGVSSGTLVNAVLAHCGSTLPSLGGPQRAGIVHRLDRDTSGVMVVAKSQRALTGLSRQFASHSQERRYLALCQGAPTPSEATILTAHGRDPRNRLRYAVLPEGQGKSARMDYAVKELFLHGGASLVECLLHTGRTHQIRVQLTHARAPLLGDAVYGSALASLRADKSLKAALLGAAKRQMLHARVLALTHPASGERLRFVSEPPADFATVLNILRNAKTVGP
jgi:23S rRNA pseudouridine1911/1915/1917 synthase